MVEGEVITGKEKWDLFKQLSKDGTILHMHLLGTDFKKLTVIKGVKRRKGSEYLLIDCPDGYRQAGADLEVLKIYFEFRGKDGIDHCFTTLGGQVAGSTIWTKFPELVERRQRRKHFRIEVPPGTVLGVEAGGTEYKMKIINLSLGGALARLTEPVKSLKEKPVFEKGQDLTDIDIVLPFEEENAEVTIRKAEVRRIEKDPVTEEYRYAFMFRDMEKEQEKLLTSCIYTYQRQMLRRRRRIYD